MNGLVFISYSTKDKHFANAICSYLENSQIRCWIAPRDISPGSQYGEEIINAINSCRVLVVVFTENANSSKYVYKEVERAVSKGAIVIPVRFQDIIPAKSLEFFLSSDHWLDAINPPIERHLEYLTKTIKAAIATEKNSLPTSKVNLNDQDDVRLFNELAPADWFAPKQKLFKWIHDLFQDKS